MKHNFHIAPIKTVEHDIDDNCIYVFCSQRDDINIGDRDNIIQINVLDTEVEDHPYRFQVKDAVVILEHILSLNSEDVFICCDSGESRSTAIAAALIEMEGGDSTYIFEDKHYHPNKLVYRVMKDILERINEGDIYLGRYGLLLSGKHMGGRSDVYAVVKSELPGELIMIPWDVYERVCNFETLDLRERADLKKMIMRTSLGVYEINSPSIFLQIDDIIDDMGSPGDVLDVAWDGSEDCWKIRNPKIYKGD